MLFRNKCSIAKILNASVENAQNQWFANLIGEDEDIAK
jgi:hypothetical protein